MSGPPSFRPAEGKPDAIRLQRLEQWAASYAAWDDARSADVGRSMIDFHERLAKMESWRVDVLVFIGQLKLKWGAVMFLAAMLSSVVTLGLAKALHL